MFFHPGYLFREPVTLMEITASHQQEIRLSDAYFNYGPLIKNHGDLPTDGGFAGFRLHAPLNQPDYYDELIVFQGGCYWRALGKNQRYGISSRGIALNTGTEGTPEEFPAFREFWLRKPKEGETFARFYGLLDGPSYTGAYSFIVYPGDDTRVDVRAVLFARKVVKRLGIAPMSSMFWFGENKRRSFDDFRPEVHDSDGLAIQMGDGERIWRPITNDSNQVEYSYFNMNECKGFGLLQRDRRFESYEDVEASYHLRPSLWIEPKSDWGAGRVMLMEIPTTNELSDNTVALWEPSTPILPGQQAEFRYIQHWTTNPDPSQSNGYVVATRSGAHDWEPNHRTVIVEFTGTNLKNLGDVHPSGQVTLLGDGNSKAVIKNINVQAIANERWRLSFQITPADEKGKLNEIGPLELRCCLKKGDDYLTETWAYRINP
jgi:glucans biosynthesis protein